MSEKEVSHGLNCPNCGGVVPIPEGQLIVKCPYCDLRSFVRGERGIRRYQVGNQTQRENAMEMLGKFLRRNWAIARDAAAKAQVTETFLVFLPFWAIWGRAAAWVFGEKKVGSGDKSRYEPREVRVVQEMSWNCAACDVGEFGVGQIGLQDQGLDPFEPEVLHDQGMVFEPVGSFAEARENAEKEFETAVRKRASLSRVAQVFVRLFRQRSGVVYYPLWVVRYLYRGRAFQVVVDGHSGKVLYGKAPGNTLYRAGVLVLGMALGAFLAVDIGALAVLAASAESDNSLGVGLVLVAAGVGIMLLAYRAFRYGEHYEYGKQKTIKAAVKQPDLLGGLPGNLGSLQLKDVEQWIDRLS